MKSFISLALLSLACAVSSATIESRQTCERTRESRFGNMVVSPRVFNPGDPISIRVDLTCARNFGVVAEFIDYSIEGPVRNDGFYQPVVLARREIDKKAFSDAFNTTIPHGFYVAGAKYNVVLTNSYSIKGIDGSRFEVKGTVLVPITLNVWL